MALLLIAAAAGLFVLWVVVEPWLVERRRRKLRALPFPARWREIIDRQVPLARGLPPRLRRQLESQMQVFLAEKSFVGCDEQPIDDEVRVTIAAQACLLALERPHAPFPRLRTILVYPSAFAVHRLRPEPSGVLQETRSVLSGESWAQDRVVLSWEDVLRGTSIPDDGTNVVIHEFAHQLDQEKGYANGAPWLGRRDRYHRWSSVLGSEYARLQQQIALGEPTLIDPYGASAPAEFFAVVSELFFERPHDMALAHPALYAQLVLLYHVDPRKWGQVHF
ncbi:MAG TPA: M90 family metallopeptidase [Usitatibacter sp.]|nr:M90 family metallopeptidase [Usitatibacter sp.]